MKSVGASLSLIKIRSIDPGYVCNNKRLYIARRADTMNPSPGTGSEVMQVWSWNIDIFLLFCHHWLHPAHVITPALLHPAPMSRASDLLVNLSRIVWAVTGPAPAHALAVTTIMSSLENVMSLFMSFNARIIWPIGVCALNPYWHCVHCCTENQVA